MLPHKYQKWLASLLHEELGRSQNGNVEYFQAGSIVALVKECWASACAALPVVMTTGSSSFHASKGRNDANYLCMSRMTGTTALPLPLNMFVRTAINAYQRDLGPLSYKNLPSWQCAHTSTAFHSSPQCSLTRVAVCFLEDVYGRMELWRSSSVRQARAHVWANFLPESSPPWRRVIEICKFSSCPPDMGLTWQLGCAGTYRIYSTVMQKGVTFHGI